MRKQRNSSPLLGDGTFIGANQIVLSDVDEERILAKAEKMVAQLLESQARCALTISTALKRSALIDSRVITIRARLIRYRARVSAPDWESREKAKHAQLEGILKNHGIVASTVLPRLSVALNHYRSWSNWRCAQPEPKQIAADLIAVAKASKNLQQALADLSNQGNALLLACSRSREDIKLPENTDLICLEICAYAAASPLKAANGRTGNRPIARAEAFLQVIQALQEASPTLKDVQARDLAAQLMRECGVKMPKDEKSQRQAVKLVQ